MKCQYCGKEFEEWTRKDKTGRVYKMKTFCSMECRGKNYTKKYKEKYGNKPTRTHEQIMKGVEKAKKTFMERYGVENASQLEVSKAAHRRQEVKDKRKKTNLEKYGVRNTFSLTKSKENAKKARAEGKCGFGSEAFRGVMLEKYGTEYSMQNKELKEKATKAYIEKYGSFPFQTEEGRRKLKEGIFKKYGVYNVSSVPEIHAKAVETYKENWKNKPEEEKRALVIKRWETFLKNNKARTSKGETSLYEYIKSNYDGEIIRNDRRILNGLEIDIYLPELKLGIEYNGLYWHSREGVNHYTTQHQEKTRLAEEAGVQLIHIYEWEWPSEDMKKYLRFLLHKDTQKIYARQCEIKEVDFPTAQAFCEEHHLQHAQSSRHSKDWTCYGLYYKGELVQLASWDHPYRSKKYEWDWQRGCPASLFTVIGGTAKLWKHFLKEKKPTSVMCHADADKFDGRSYAQIGMKLKEWQKRIYYVMLDGSVTSYIPRQEENRRKMFENWSGVSVQSAGTKLFIWENNK